ncbi:MAG TPA: DUF6510 family protein [Streptosporangiaceae bacterium]
MDAVDGSVVDGSVVDGNAIGGLLHEVFGAEMTAAVAACGSCGMTGPVAGMVVYRHAPGVVARCRGCGSLLMVIVTARGLNCVDLRGLARLDPPSERMPT